MATSPLIPRGLTSAVHRAVGVCLVLAICGCSDFDLTAVAASEDSEKGRPVASNPIANLPLYAEPVTHASRTAADWGATRPLEAAHLDVIARTPQAVWFTGWQDDVRTAAATYVTAALASHAVPVLVAYNIPQRDCGLYSAGGSADMASYLEWIRRLAHGIGAARAVVVLEPDALAGLDCLTPADRHRRMTMIGEAVRLLKANAGTVVYIDGGHARWHAVDEMAGRLRAAGIDHADGFALNVSNFIPTAETVAYGEALSAQVGGKHFVIDSSRNGQGPSPGNEWCNPSGRGLGAKPTTVTGHDLVDAMLWIKRPGESDGTCGGGPPAGAWWPEYAIELSRRANTVLALR